MPANETPSERIRLTRFSHGAGCGCKIAPAVLDQILRSNETYPDNKRLLVGNHSRDDAAAYDLGNGQALVSTTDFFMPIVDDPYDFGRIAAANSISDVYAMGATPVLAIAILGWPLDKLPIEAARRVVEGSRAVCAEAGIPLAGGHSIDSPEPMHGLAVNGLVALDSLKRNNTARPGNLLFLTKPLGVGILTTAEKRGVLQAGHIGVATREMTQLNSAGAAFGALRQVTAMTDVTGFGLLGHLSEMARGSGARAEISFAAIPLLPELGHYIRLGSIPGGAGRNWSSYGQWVSPLPEYRRVILSDPQTSGGLLVAVEESGVEKFQTVLREAGLERFTEPIGRILPPLEATPNSEEPTIIVAD